MRTKDAMMKPAMAVTLCVALLWLRPAYAAPTPYELCGKLRAAAWGKYQSCAEKVASKTFGATSGDSYKAFWTCRHNLDLQWTKFQTMSSLTGSPCVGSRFVDNGDGTETDNLTELTWERKTSDSTAHDGATAFTWSAVAPYDESGTAFTTFLQALNSGGGFAGSNGWRLPTLEELQTILADFPCTGTGGSGTCTCTGTCLAFSDPNTQSDFYWTATSHLFVYNAWIVYFGYAGITNNPKPYSYYVRAVRGGW